jgi:diketogulonate reductase-like aldo/keto reductase
MILEENYILNNGVEIPKLALGTWLIDNEDVKEPVKAAIEIGYRHIDTAQAYQNESGVGEGIRESSVNRGDIFVTSKIAAELKTYDKAAASIDETLAKMKLDYIDLMIIHSPKPWKDFHGDDHYLNGNQEVWRALEDAYQAGKVRAIGLSNFEKKDVDNILESCSVKPMVNQILAHIGNTPEELISYTQDKGILVEAYSPIGHGKLFNNDQVVEVAEKYDVSVPQLGIRYALQLGLLPIPKSGNPKHIKSNAELDFTISEKDMEILKGIKEIDYEDASMFPVYGGEL